MYVFMHVCMYVYTFVNTHTHTLYIPGATHSAGLLPFIGNMRSSVLGEGLSLSPARRGNAALEVLFSSEDEAEL